MPDEVRIQTYWIAEFKYVTDAWNLVKDIRFKSKEEAQKAIDQHRDTFSYNNIKYRITKVILERTSFEA